MKLFLLKPRENWNPWYDKAFGFVVAAQTRKRARQLASIKCGDEGEEVWLNSKLTSCKEIILPKKEGIILRDFASA